MAKTRNDSIDKVDDGPTIDTNKNLKKVKVALSARGHGILFNPMTDEKIDELAGIRPKSASEKDLPLRDRAEKKIIRENGKVGIPATYILSALIYAGRYVKNGKNNVSTAKTTTVFEFLTIHEEFFPFLDQSEQWIVDKRRGTASNGKTEAAIALIRPKFKNWSVSFTIEIDESLISLITVKQLFEEAGRKSGVGDYRPQKKGPFGMFDVSDWKTSL